VLYNIITPAEKMPKKPNEKKAASAQYQSIKALAEAASGAEGLVYLAVMKPLGNRYFLCQQEAGYPVMAEPRKLFTRGSMRVEKGCIVVAQEPHVPLWKRTLQQAQRQDYVKACAAAKAHGGEPPAPELGLPYEIVGVIAERSEAKRLIKTGRMPQSVLDMALAAETGPGAATGEAKPLLHDDLEFMTAAEMARAEKEEMLAAMSPEERAAYATRVQLEKRMQMSGGGGGTFTNSGLDLDEVSEFRGKDEGHHASRGLKQARMAADARASIQNRLAALLSGSKKAAAAVVVGDVLLDDQEAPVVAGGPRRFKQLRPKKTEEQKAAELAAARSKVELEQLVSGLMGSSHAAEAAAEAAEITRLQAELAALGAVENWEDAADGLASTPPEQEVLLEDL
jgi:hypothetical protein